MPLQDTDPTSSFGGFGLNSDTDHFFRESILADQPSVEGPQITSEKRLASARTQIAAYLKENGGTDGNARKEWLRSLHVKITTQLCFTLYEVDSEAEVGVIFEVMNDRGKPLTDLEKVKNYLLHTSTFLEVPNELAKSVNEAWGEILRQFMAAGLVSSADEDRLLRAHWLTHYNHQSKQWQGTRSVKGRFSLREHKGKHATLLDLLHRYTEGLRASCISFCDAYEPHRPDAFESFKTDPWARAQVIEWSAKLGRVGVIAPFLPLMLAVRERWPNDPNKYLEIVKLCEAFAFRVYRVTGFRADAGQSALFHLGYELAHKSKDFDDAIKRLILNLYTRCGDEEFKTRTSVDHPQMRAAYSWSGLRYFLYEYEIALASKQGASPQVTWDELRKSDLRNTIEHILPQSIDQQPYWKERFQGRKHQRYVHDLGNLTLTKHNPHYLNKPFRDKKGAVNAEGHCYAKSPLYVERELTQWTDWDASAIEERRAKLLEWARDRWAVDLSGHEEHEPESDEDELDEGTDQFVDDSGDEA